MMRRFHCLLLVPLLASPLYGQAVRYEVSVAQNQFHVTAIFPTAGKETLFVSLPAWSPGNYEIQNYARYVHGFTASNSAGASLRWDRRGKDTGRVVTGGSERLYPGFDFGAHTLQFSHPPV